MSQVRLSIAIVTFNSGLVVRSCLDKFNFDRYDVFVVDNNSSDDTTQIIRDEFPKVNLIALKENIGYGRANNIVLKQAKTDYVLILNPDAFMYDEDLQKAIEIMDQNPNFGLASPNTLHSNYLPEIASYREKINALKDEKKISFCDFIIGGVMFVNLKNMKKVGFFDENIFMFSEDNEISLKSIENGYKNIVMNQVLAFHLGAGSSRKSLRTIYRRFWHLGWSKSYWRRRRKSWINTKRATLRLVIVYLFEALFNLIKLNKEKVVSKFAFAMGCASHLIGLKAFDKNGKARG